jgi:homoserine O-acetyltransferase/O-succinyltransferase
MQVLDPSREKADADLERFIDSNIADLDANDVLYAFDASRNYDPSAKLDQINAAIMWVNSADDAVNPPELGIAEEQIKKVRRGRIRRLMFVLG